MADSYCSNCRQELRLDDRFCPGCGRPVHETVPVPTSESNAPTPSPPQQTNAVAHQRVQRPLHGLRSFLLDVVVPVGGASAGLLGVFSAVLYVVGLIAVLLPLWRSTGDFHVAWYATSLTPRLQVVGLGIGKLLAVPTLFFMWFTICISATIYVEARWPNRKILVIVVGVLLGAPTFFLILWGEAASPRHALIYALIGAGVLGVLLALIGPVGRLIIRAWGRIRVYRGKLSRESGAELPSEVEAGMHNESESPHDERPSWRDWLGVFGHLMVPCVGFLVLGTPIAALSAPPLPKVEITTGTNGPNNVNGALIAHMDGSWHILANEGVDEFTVIAISDDEVKQVRVVAEGKEGD